MQLRLWVGRVGDAVTAVVHAAVVALACVMLLSIGWQVFMRYVFNKPPSWTEELALLCFSWTVLLMLALGVRHAFHVNIDLLAKLAPPGIARWLDRCVLTLTAVFGAYLARGGLTYVVETASATSAAIAYPIYALHLAAPVCGALVLWFALERLITDPQVVAGPRESAQ